MCSAFLYTNKDSQKKPKENNPIYNRIQKNKYLEVTVTEEVKGLCAENHKTLIKETEDDTYKWEDVSCSW